MIKAFVISDLHLEFRNQQSQLKVLNSIVEGVALYESDLLILAGDIATSKASLDNAIISLSTRMPETLILFVLGNHEFYGHDFVENEYSWKKNELPGNVVYLGDGDVYFHKEEGIVIHGLTGWITCEYIDIHKNKEKYSQYNDFNCIKNFDKTALHGKRNFQRLANNVRFFKEAGFKQYVVSHFLPSFENIHSEYIGNHLNPCFANEWTEFITLHPEIKTWIYGHTHKPHRNYINKTRLVCNPLGYPFERKDINVHIEYLGE